MPEKRLHPSDDQLNAFSLGQLPPADAAEIENHISVCDPCCETLLQLSTDDTFIALLQDTKKPDDGLTLDQTDGADANDRQPPAAVHSALAEHPRYKLLELIAKGGMGDVFKAEHRMMERTVALKVIRQELMRKPEAVERFHREVKTAASLSHANIVTSHDAEQAGDVHFLVMEYVDGVDLAKLVKQRGALPVSEACDFIRQAATGLQYAHERGMVHRDIKPHNLMVTDDRTVKILDFGLASLTESLPSAHEEILQESSLTAAGTIMGTPDFISPEQAENAHTADVRSDIYSLGATLYYLLSGKPPFADGSVMHKLKSHAEDEPEPIQNIQIEVPDELAEVMHRMMAKNPADRFQSPAELAEALAPFVDRHRDDVPPIKPEPKADRARRSPRLTVKLMLGAMGLLFAGIIYVVTDRGTLVIESDDPNIEIAVRPLLHESHEGNKHSLAWQYRIGDTITGSTIKKLRSGAYIVDLKGRENEFNVSQDRFVLKRGGKVVVTVTRKNEPLQELAASAMQADALEEVRTFDEHKAPVRDVVVAPNGDWFATCDSEGRVLVRTLGGDVKCEFSVPWRSVGPDGRYDGVAELIATPDSRSLLTAGIDPMIRVWNVETGEIERQLTGHPSFVTDMQLSGDGRVLVSADESGPVLVWDFTAGTFEKHDLDPGRHIEVQAVDVSHDGSQMVIGRWNGSVSLWSTSGQLLRSLGRHESWVRAVTFSSDDKLVASCGADGDNVIRIWDVETGTAVNRLTGYDDGVRGAVFTSDGKFVIGCSSDQTIRVHEIETGRLMVKQEVIGHGANRLALTPDDRYALTCGGSKFVKDVFTPTGNYNVQLWRLPDSLWSKNPKHRVVKPIRDIPHEAMHSSLTYLPDGTIVTSARDLDLEDKDWKLYFTRPLSDQIENPLSTGPGGISHIVTTPDGKWLVVGKRSESAVQLWNAERRELVHTFDASGMVHGVSISPDGKLVAAASWDGSAKVWNLETRQLVKELTDVGQVHRVQFSPDGNVLAVSSRPAGKTVLFDSRTWRKLSEFNNRYAVGQMSFSPDSKIIATGGCGVRSVEAWKTWVRVWDVATGEMLMEFKEMQNAVSAVAISPDARYLIAIGGDQGNQPNLPEPIRVWDLDAKRLVAEFDGHDRCVRAVAFLPGGKHFATVSKGVKVWNLEDVVGPPSPGTN